MTPEQIAAHQFRVKGARKVTLMGRREVMEDELEAARTRNGERLKVKHSVAQKSRRLTERQVMMACMDILEAHPRVLLWWRVNVGGVKFGQQWVKFGFRGASDLMGVMVGGKYLAVETKTTGGKATPDQDRFLMNVRAAGGLAMCVDDPQQLIEALASL